MSQISFAIVKYYNSMYAYRYHFCVDEDRRRSNVTFNIEITSIIIQSCKLSQTNYYLIEAAL